MNNVCEIIHIHYNKIFKWLLTHYQAAIEAQVDTFRYVHHALTHVWRCSDITSIKFRC